MSSGVGPGLGRFDTDGLPIQLTWHLGGRGGGCPGWGWVRERKTLHNFIFPGSKMKESPQFSTRSQKLFFLTCDNSKGLFSFI